MNEPRIGEAVQIVPLHSRVPMGENTPGRWLDVSPRVVQWSPWWSQRMRDGDVVIVPVATPAPSPLPATVPVSLSDSEGNQ